MKKFLLSLGAILMILVVAGPMITTDAKNGNERVLVVFQDHVPDHRKKTTIRQAQGSVIHDYEYLSAVAVSIPKQAVQGLSKNPNVAFIEQDVHVHIHGQVEDWGIGQIKANEAWNTGYKGENVQISVIDTGVDLNHDDLVIAGGASFVSYTDSYQDDNGHGTHVAGIIGARDNELGTIGVAHASNVYAVKVVNQNGSGYLSDVIAGIDWSIQNDMDIVNISLGTPNHSESLQQIVDEAYNQGILVVASAGNSGQANGEGDSVYYPARYDSVIAVAATDQDDQRFSYSATGGTIEVAAPGVDIYSTYMNNSYATFSGTSMASPYVAGNLALLMQAYPELNHEDIRTKLHEYALDLGDENHFGHGLIQSPTAADNGETDEDEEQKDEDVNEDETNEDESSEENSNEGDAKDEEDHTELNSTVFTDQEVYTRGDTVNITVKVMDEIQQGVIGAEVELGILPLKGKSMSATGITDENGEFTYSFNVHRRNHDGEYVVEAKVEYRDSVLVQENQFHVTRK